MYIILYPTYKERYRHLEIYVEAEKSGRMRQFLRIRANVLILLILFEFNDLDNLYMRTCVLNDLFIYMIIYLENQLKSYP